MKKVIVVEGMDTLLIGKAMSHILEGMNGVDKVSLNLDEESVTVEYGRGVLTEDDLCDAIGGEGFEVVDIYDA